MFDASTFDCSVWGRHQCSLSTDPPPYATTPQPCVPTRDRSACNAATATGDKGTRRNLRTTNATPLAGANSDRSYLRDATLTAQTSQPSRDTPDCDGSSGPPQPQHGCLQHHPGRSYATRQRLEIRGTNRTLGTQLGATRSKTAESRAVHEELGRLDAGCRLPPHPAPSAARCYAQLGTLARCRILNACHYHPPAAPAFALCSAGEGE